MPTTTHNTKEATMATTTTTPTINHLPNVQAGVYHAAALLSKGFTWGDLYAAEDAGHCRFLPDPSAGGHADMKPITLIRVFF